MKISILKFGSLAAALLGAVNIASAEECDQLAAEVSAAVEAEPAKVLVIVDDAISKNEACACEVVKAAISAADANDATVREIVVTAVSAAQSQAATIAECAVAEAPSAAAEIKAGLAEVFEGAKGGAKSVVYDDGYSAKGGKAPVYEEEVEEDFGPEPVVISGVYLIAPSATTAGFGLRDDKGRLITQEDLDRQERLIEILRRRQRDGRDPDRGGSGTSGPDPTDPK